MSAAPIHRRDMCRPLDQHGNSKDHRQCKKEQLEKYLALRLPKSVIENGHRFRRRARYGTRFQGKRREIQRSFDTLGDVQSSASKTADRLVKVRPPLAEFTVRKCLA